MRSALLLVLLFATSAAGQIWPVEAKPPHLVLVRAGDSAGSGVCVWNKDLLSIVATCSHVVSDAPNYVSANGIRGTLIANDPRADVALIKVPAKFYAVKIRDPIALDEASDKLWPTKYATCRIGEVVYSEGFPGMRKAYRQGPVIGTIGSSIEARFVSLPGHSGGPAYVNGELVGLVWGGPENYQHAAITPARNIQRLLARILGKS